METIPVDMLARRVMLISQLLITRVCCSSRKAEIPYEGESVADLWPGHCCAREEHKTCFEGLNALRIAPERAKSLTSEGVVVCQRDRLRP